MTATYRPAVTFVNRENDIPSNGIPLDIHRMGIGQRIGERLKGQGLSQAELARRVGLRQSTVNALVNGQSRSSAHLHLIARELETTVAYLAGETSDPEAEFPDYHFTSEEIGWVQKIAALAPADRASLLALADSLAGKRAGRGLHDKVQEYRAG